MGPRRIRRGERGARFSGVDCSKKLQWGHGEFAVENVIYGTHGAKALKLQWGHGEFAVENPSAPKFKERNAMLQWGHGEFAVENGFGRLRSKMTVESFNGATANSPWRTTSSTVVSVSAQAASMGPRRIRRGEPAVPSM